MEEETWSRRGWRGRGCILKIVIAKCGGGGYNFCMYFIIWGGGGGDKVLIHHTFLNPLPLPPPDINMNDSLSSLNLIKLQSPGILP